MLSLPPPFALAISAFLAYFLGGLPFGYWFVRRTLGKDIRTMGSGNIGATNVHRSAGRKAGVIVLLLDIFKGLLAVWLASVLSRNDPRALALAAIFVMIGHCYPALLNFKGGKAVACFIGAFVYLAPLAMLVSAVVFIATVVLSKYISLASILGALVFPFAVGLISRPPQPILLASIAAALLIIYRHKGNIARLRAGTEPAFSTRGGQTA